MAYTSKNDNQPAFRLCKAPALFVGWVNPTLCLIVMTWLLQLAGEVKEWSGEQGWVILIRQPHLWPTRKVETPFWSGSKNNLIKTQEKTNGHSFERAGTAVEAGHGSIGTGRPWWDYVNLKALACGLCGFSIWESHCEPNSARFCLLSKCSFQF